MVVSKLFGLSKGWPMGPGQGTSGAEASSVQTQPLPPVSALYNLLLSNGDSELVGIDYPRAAQDVSWPRCSQYRSRAPFGINPSITPLDQAIAPDGNNYTSLLEFSAKSLSERDTSNEVLICSHAYNGTSLISSGHSLAVGDSLYESFITRANAAIAAAVTAKPGSTVKAIYFWDNGAANDGPNYASQGLTKAGFKAATANKIADTRTRLFQNGVSGATVGNVPIVLAPCIPEQVFAYANGSTPNYGPRLFSEALAEVAAEGTNVFFYNIPSGNTNDNLHPTTAGNRIYGAAADALVASTNSPAVSTSNVFSAADGSPVAIPLAADVFFTPSVATTGWEVIRSYGAGDVNAVSQPVWTLRLTGNANASYASPPASPSVVFKGANGRTTTLAIAVTIAQPYGQGDQGPVTSTYQGAVAYTYNGGGNPTFVVPAVPMGKGLNLLYFNQEGGSAVPTSVTVAGVAASAIFVRETGGGAAGCVYSIIRGQAGNVDVTVQSTTGSGSVVNPRIAVVTMTGTKAAPFDKGLAGTGFVASVTTPTMAVPTNGTVIVHAVTPDTSGQTVASPATLLGQSAAIVAAKYGTGTNTTITGGSGYYVATAIAFEKSV